MIKKALKNKYFIIVCIYDIIIVLLHCYQSISEYNKNTEEFLQYGASSDIQYNPYAPIVNAFTLWIGFDTGNIFSKLFYFLFPIMTVLPCCYDIKNKQSDKSIQNIKEFDYHLSKYITIFIIAGFTTTFPLLLDFLIIMLFIPSIFPDSVYDIYYGIFSNNFMADIFYGQPFLYVLIFLFICFIFCGLFGSLGYTITTLIKSKIATISIPVALIFSIEYIKKLIVKNNIFYNIEFSPLSFLCPAKSYTTNWKIIIFEIIILFLFTFTVSVIRFKISDIKSNISNN